MHVYGLTSPYSRHSAIMSVSKQIESLSELCDNMMDIRGILAHIRSHAHVRTMCTTTTHTHIQQLPVAKSRVGTYAIEICNF